MPVLLRAGAWRMPAARAKQRPKRSVDHLLSAGRRNAEPIPRCLHLCQLTAPYAYIGGFECNCMVTVQRSGRLHCLKSDWFMQNSYLKLIINIVYEKSKGFISWIAANCNYSAMHLGFRQLTAANKAKSSIRAKRSGLKDDKISASKLALKFAILSRMAE